MTRKCSKPAPSLIGVTLFSPCYAEMGQEAARRFREFTGLEVQVLRTRREPAFDLKLRLDLLCSHRPIVYFDADWWLLREAKFDPPPCAGFAAVHDPSVWTEGAFPHEDCIKFGLNPQHYFNSGLFICDLRSPLTRRVFRMARERHALAVRHDLGRPHDWTDQFYLNEAMQRCGLTPSLLPFAWNFYKLAADWGAFPFIPREIFGLHAAGVPVKHKLDVLRAQASVFGSPISPMRQRAVAFAHAQQFELR